MVKWTFERLKWSVNYFATKTRYSCHKTMGSWNYDRTKLQDEYVIINDERPFIGNLIIVVLTQASTWALGYYSPNSEFST